MFGVLFSAPASTQTLVTPCHKACDIMRSFRYLGYKTTWERVEHVSREVDNDSSGYISFQDGLQLVFADFSCYPARRLLIWLDWLTIINWSFDLWICFYLDLFRGAEVFLDFCSYQYLAGAVEIDPPHPRRGTGGHRIHLRSFGRRWHEVPREATWHVFISNWSCYFHLENPSAFKATFEGFDTCLCRIEATRLQQCCLHRLPEGWLKLCWDHLGTCSKLSLIRWPVHFFPFDFLLKKTYERKKGEM